MQHHRLGASAERLYLAVQGVESRDAEARIGSLGAFADQEFAAIGDDVIVAAIVDLGVEAQRAVVRGIGDVGMDVKLVPADTVDACQAGLGQACPEAARSKARTATFEVIGIVDADQVANDPVLSNALVRLLRRQRTQNPSAAPR